MWQLTYAVYVLKDDLLFSCYFMGKHRTTEGNVELYAPTYAIHLVKHEQVAMAGCEQVIPAELETKLNFVITNRQAEVGDVDGEEFGRN